MGTMLGPEIVPILVQGAASLGLLTPLILGLYGFSRDKKKEAVPPAVLAKAVEATEVEIDFESVALQALSAQIAMHERREAYLENENKDLKADLKQTRAALVAAGLPFP